MFDFGDEFVIDSYRIPWLIWIQLLVMFLLIILLYFFTSSSLDPSSSAAPPPSFAGSFCSTDDSPLLPGTVSGCLRDSKDGETERNKETGTSRGVVAAISRKEDIEEMEGFSTKDRANIALFGRPQHPCNFLGVATQAFLKCLGLDSSSSDTSSTKKHSRKHS
ncbi:hypothetical protein LguiA_003262 [Lonicera macranthoides]